MQASSRSERCLHRWSPTPIHFFELPRSSLTRRPPFSQSARIGWQAAAARAHARTPGQADFSIQSIVAWPFAFAFEPSAPFLARLGTPKSHENLVITTTTRTALQTTTTATATTRIPRTQVVGLLSLSSLRPVHLVFSTASSLSSYSLLLTSINAQASSPSQAHQHRSLCSSRHLTLHTRIQSPLAPLWMQSALNHSTRSNHTTNVVHATSANAVPLRRPPKRTSSHLSSPRNASPHPRDPISVDGARSLTYTNTQRRPSATGATTMAASGGGTDSWRSGGEGLGPSAPVFPGSTSNGNGRGGARNGAPRGGGGGPSSSNGAGTSSKKQRGGGGGAGGQGFAPPAGPSKGKKNKGGK